MNDASANGPAFSAAPSSSIRARPVARKSTLRLRGFLGTHLDLVRIELTGVAGAGVPPFGRLAVFAPFLVVGYLLILGGLARLLALPFGWAGSMFLLGGLHLTVGLIGVLTGNETARITRFPIVDPELSLNNASDDGVRDAMERADTLVTPAHAVRSKPPAFPPRNRASV